MSVFEDDIAVLVLRWGNLKEASFEDLGASGIILRWFFKK
jgi:hypothetical protein